MAASKNPLVRLRHIQDEIEGITKALTGVDRQAFLEDYVLRRAGERALLIISEAAKALPDGLTDRYPDIDWPGIRSLGNVLRHEYQAIDPDTLWLILTAKLAELAPIVSRMIRETDG
jgi:uncharacterized protein with HEPN domain